MAVAQHPVPEQYFLLPTKHSPNNTLPALVYRNVLPVPYNEATTTDTLTNHNWIKKVRRGLSVFENRACSNEGTI